MLSRFSHRWTVVTSRFRYAAISFHESRRSPRGVAGGGEPAEDGALMRSVIAAGDAIVASPEGGGNRRHSAANRCDAPCAADCSLMALSDSAIVRLRLHIGVEKQ